MTVVEVIPLVAGAAPVIVGSSVVGAVIGVLGLLVQGASLGVLDESLGVQVGRLLAVEDGAHCCKEAFIRTQCKTRFNKQFSILMPKFSQEYSPG